MECPRNRTFPWKSRSGACLFAWVALVVIVFAQAYSTESRRDGRSSPVVRSGRQSQVDGRNLTVSPLPSGRALAHGPAQGSAGNPPACPLDLGSRTPLRFRTRSSVPSLAVPSTLTLVEGRRSSRAGRGGASRNFGSTFTPNTPLDSLFQRWVC